MKDDVVYFRQQLNQMKEKTNSELQSKLKQSRKLMKKNKPIKEALFQILKEKNEIENKLNIANNDVNIVILQREQSHFSEIKKVHVQKFFPISHKLFPNFLLTTYRAISFMQKFM